MTLLEFIDEIPSDKACYIAIIPMCGQYDLEVEVNHGTIGGVYRTEEPTTQLGLASVRLMADELDRLLTGRGIRVFKTRKEWDEYDE